MNPTDFTEQTAGRLVKGPRDYWSFVPHPLPPELALSWELVAQLSEADRALSQLRGVAQTLPNPHLLIGPFVRREAVLSSRIEGTQASLSDLLLFEAGGKDGESPRQGEEDVQEVANYVRALEYGLGRLSALPVSLRLVREMHERLLAGVRGQHLTPGEFRRTQNWIGPPGSTLTEATYVPPQVEDMKEAMGALERFWHAPSVLPPLVRIALAHYQFEAIHPFLDGNGRIGRLLITLLLATENLLPQPLLYLSAYFEQNRREYYARLLAVSQRGEWEEWLLFFLRGVAEQSQDAVARSQRLLALWQSSRDALLRARSSALVLRLLDALFASPALTVAGASRELGITARSAQQNIDRLVGAGILRESTGRQRGRVYVAESILAIVDGTAAGNFLPEISGQAS